MSSPAAAPAELRGRDARLDQADDHADDQRHHEHLVALVVGRRVEQAVLEGVAVVGGGDQDRAAGAGQQRREQLRQAVGGEGEEDREGDDRRGDAAAREGEEGGQRHRGQRRRGQRARRAAVLAQVGDLEQQRNADRDQPPRGRSSS